MFRYAILAALVIMDGGARAQSSAGITTPANSLSASQANRAANEPVISFLSCIDICKKAELTDLSDKDKAFFETCSSNNLCYKFNVPATAAIPFDDKNYVGMNRNPLSNIFKSPF